MSNYARYKKWWIEHQAKDFIPSLYYGDDAETAFRQHVGEMNSYELMETLEDWGEEPIPVQEPSITKLLNDLVEKFEKQHNYPPMEQTPSRPYPYIKYPTQDNPFPYPTPLPGPFPVVNERPQCPKCGIALSGVMGYVCSDQHCPTFMKVTC